MDTRLKIALVEDNDDLKYLLCRDISGAGYAVESAGCAEDLDDLAAAAVFDVLILDINLPGENGLEIARRYKQSNPDVYIIMLTARVGTEDKVVGYQAGADIYLTKPVASAASSGYWQCWSKAVKATTAGIRGCSQSQRDDTCWPNDGRAESTGNRYSQGAQSITAWQPTVLPFAGVVRGRGQRDLQGNTRGAHGASAQKNGRCGRPGQADPRDSGRRLSIATAYKDFVTQWLHHIFCSATICGWFAIKTILDPRQIKGW